MFSARLVTYRCSWAQTPAIKVDNLGVHDYTHCTASDSDIDDVSAVLV